MKRAVTKVSCLVFIVLILAACSSDDNADGDEAIIGKWKASDKDGNDCPNTIQLYDDEDHTFSMTYEDKGNVTGTYKDLAQDDNYKLKFEDEEKVFKFESDEDSLTVSDPDGNEACVYKPDDGNSDDNENEEGSNTAENNQADESTTSNENNVNDADKESHKDEYEAYRAKVGPVDDEGESDIWFEGESTLENDEVIVYGQTNLLSGSKLYVNPTGEDSSFSGGWSNATVEDDGTFYAENEIPSNFNDQLFEDITFTPEDQEDDIKDHYQPEEEELDGPFTYLDYEEGEEELAKKAKVELAFPEDETQSTVGIEEPDWDKPDDYGSTDVWMEGDIDKDDEYVYVDGESNLLEGTDVSVSFEIPDKVQIGYNDTVKVDPDGSFEAEIKNPEKKEDIDDYAVHLQVGINETDWPNVIDNYGEDGENFEGSLTEEENDETKIIKEVDVE